MRDGRAGLGHPPWQGGGWPGSGCRGSTEGLPRRILRTPTHMGLLSPLLTYLLSPADPPRTTLSNFLCIANLSVEGASNCKPTPK